MQWYVSESTGEAAAVKGRRLEVLLNSPALSPPAAGALVIAATGDRTDGPKPAHGGRPDRANLGKIDTGGVAVSSRWADERVDYPWAVEPSTPAAWFEGGKATPPLRTTLTIAVALVQQAMHTGLPLRAVVADSF